jgi:ribonuclease G
LRREILVESAAGEIRIAVLEDDLLAEISVERPGRRGVSGNIYKGRVRNVLPGMQSAFVDIGLERDAFLYVEDLGDRPRDVEELEGLESCEGPVPEGPATAPRGGIEDLLREGQEVVVQVAKDPIGQKGARITAQASLPGRFLVYLPRVEHIGVSRKITGLEERERLKALVEDLARTQGLPGGFIVRTAGEGATAEEIAPDARYLVEVWQETLRKAETSGAPALLHQEAGAVARVLRDVLNHDVERVLVDAQPILLEALDFVNRVQPGLAPKIRLWTGTSPIFEERGVEQQIERALRSRVWLKSGGSIVINQTEALVAIDVNTGKYVGKQRLEETILKTNLEAAREIVRQVRLRDLGGIIVIDFIDMEEAASREEVARALERELRNDRSKSRMLQISEFGLVEITRQRTKRSLERALLTPCSACGGSGRTKSSETLYFEILREVRRRRLALPGGPVVVRVHPEVARQLEQRASPPADGSDHPEAGRVVFRGDASLGFEQFSLPTD